MVVLSSNQYKLKLQIVDYNSKFNQITYVDYKYHGAATIGYDAKYIVDNMLEGTPIEFVVDSVPENNPDDIHPVIIKMTAIKLSNEAYGQTAPTLYGQIVLVDGIALSPIDQKGDVYDNVKAQGFEIYDVYSVSAKTGVSSKMDVRN